MQIFKYLFVLTLCQLGLSTSAYAQDSYMRFTISDGSVTITPARCPPETCKPKTAALGGWFDAAINSNEINIGHAGVTTKPDIQFSLPEQPNVSSNGTTREAKFVFDGTTLKLKGKVDSRAFDGPLYEYSLSAVTASSAGFDAQGYYTARQDFRKCVSPLCGGIFVKAVNQKYTKCADGKRREECYVGTVDWSAVGGHPFGSAPGLGFNESILVQGELKPMKDKQFGNLGKFVAKAAYRPATANPGRGKFVALENKGIFCITTPCFSTEEYYLNKRRTRTISGFDFNPTGASAKDVDAAYSLYAENVPVLAVGYNKRERGFAGVGITFYANQFYLPINRTPTCTKGYLPEGTQCLTPHGCAAPQLELTTFGGAAMVDPITGEISASISYSCVDSCDAPAEMTGPGRCSLALP